jgi:hypothetical protein
MNDISASVIVIFRIRSAQKRKEPFNTAIKRGASISLLLIESEIELIISVIPSSLINISNSLSCSVIVFI